MFKIIHFADTHLGIESYGRIDPSTGLSARLSDFLRAIDRIIDTALLEEADLVLFCGDAYKTRNPSQTYQREFARRISRLSQAELPTVLVTGNHDKSNTVGSAHTMEIFDTLGIDHVYVAHSPDVLTIETRQGPIQVGVLPWISRSSLLSHDKHKNKSLQEVNETLALGVEQILKGEGGFVSRLDPQVPHILASHGSVQGATYGSERTVMLGQEMILPLSLLKDPIWDYVALGHIHKHQAIEPNRPPPVVYSGSVERIDFGEEHDDKGFVIAEVERGQCTWSFRKLDARRLVTIQATVGGNDPTKEIVEAIGRGSVEGAIVRVIIHTTADSDLLIRENEIRHALRDAFSVTSIVHDVQRTQRLRLGNTAEISRLAPLDALEQYLEAKETPPERMAVLKEYAEALASQERLNRSEAR